MASHASSAAEPTLARRRAESDASGDVAISSVLPRWWMWPTILSLDAPLVALLWQQAFAESFAVSLGTASRAILFLAIFAVYVIDRALDARALNRRGHAPSTARHRFYARWPSASLRVGFLALATALVWGILVGSGWLLLCGLSLVAALAAYLLLVHGRRTARRFGGRWGGLKEFAVAALFAVGVSLAPLARVFAEAPSQGIVIGQAAIHGIAVFALFWLNILSIAWFERAADRQQRMPSFVAAMRKRGVAAGCDKDRQFAPTAAWLLLLAAVLLACSWLAWVGGDSPSMLYVGWSSVALTGLLLAERHLSVERLRVLADVALLTPLLGVVLSWPL